MPPVDPRVPDGSGDGRARSEHERFRELEAGVAQPAEHLPCKQKVAGSIPAASSTGREGAAQRMRRGLQSKEGFPSGQREQTVNLPAYAFEGSNPSPSTNPVHETIAGIAQLVERQPSKLNVTGSNPVSRSNEYLSRREMRAHLAQLVEHVLGKDEVTSSILVVGSKPVSRRATR